ncbi:MAG: DNA polymerase III subunit gamma/tau [Cyanobacteria bacterium P01_H01_bin.74]
MHATEQDNKTKIERYIPLYRKYRPKTFVDLCGQSIITQTLCNAIALQKVVHAYLFCGPRGTGKTSAARIFAKSLNCEQGASPEPCLQCASCTGIAEGQALDIIEFDAASNNGVNDARELIESCQYRPISGRYKVYIIDEVHMLTTQAFNALLKTLEEPPENVIFIFATTEAHKVLQTIVSRCQRFDFARIGTQEIVDRLRTIADWEAITISPEALHTIARHAKGGLRDAVGLLDQVSVMGRAQPGITIQHDDILRFTGALSDDVVLALGDSVLKQDGQLLLSHLGELIGQGVQPTQILKDLTQHFRNLLVVQTDGSGKMQPSLGLSAEYYQALLQQADLLESQTLLPQLLNRLAETERNIRNTQNPGLWLEIGLLELVYRHEIYQLETLQARVEKLEALLQDMQDQGTDSRGTPLEKMPGQPLPAQKKPSLSASENGSAIKNSSQAYKPVSAPVSPEKTDLENLETSKTLDKLDKDKIDKPLLKKSMPSAKQAAPPTQQTTAPDNEQHSAPLVDKPQTLHLNPPAETPLEKQSAFAALYQNICAQIPSRMYRSLLQQQTQLLNHTNNKLTVGCVGHINLATVTRPDKMLHLEKAAEKVLGYPVQIDCTEIQKLDSALKDSAIVSHSPPSPPSPNETPEQPQQPNQVNLPNQAKQTFHTPPYDTQPQPQESVKAGPESQGLEKQGLENQGLEKHPLEAQGPIPESEQIPPDLLAQPPSAGSALSAAEEESKQHALEILQGKFL